MGKNRDLFKKIGEIKEAFHARMGTIKDEIVKSTSRPYRVLKSRGITLPTKVCIVKAMVLPVVLYGCEIWTRVKAEP